MHTLAYTAVVLAGEYVEAGDAGRHRLRAGDVIRHRPFEGHLNRFDEGGAEVLVLTVDWKSDSLRGAIIDPDQIARLAERDVIEALACLQEQFVPQEVGSCDWPDRLARALIADPTLGLRAWAGRQGLHPGSLSRRFDQEFGITPAQFRLTAKFHRARALLASRRGPLGEIALRAGFADQAHMARTVRKCSGTTSRELISPCDSVYPLSAPERCGLR